MLEPFLQLLQDGCRCFSLALVESTELQDKTKLQAQAFKAPAACF